MTTMMVNLIDDNVERKTTSLKRKQSSGTEINHKPIIFLADRHRQNAMSAMMQQAYRLPASTMTTTTMIMMKMTTYLPMATTEEPE